MQSSVPQLNGSSCVSSISGNRLLPNLSPNAETVLRKRYLQKDDAGNPTEEPADLFRRVAESIAAGSQAHGDFDPEEAERYYAMMCRAEFLPNSPTLMNAGKADGQLSACFVLPVPDSMEGIFETLKQTALIHKTGGGTGFSFSRLRPRNSIVNSTKGVSSGPISFIRVFDTATEAVKQGGVRRGANMAILRVDHPDILAFIDCKASDATIANFNISVALTDEFMAALAVNSSFALRDPKSGAVFEELSARSIFDRIVEAAWRNGEPGIVFIDRINKDNPTPKLGTIESTNPCGEQPLLPYESCNLGSINLATMWTENEHGPCVDYDKLENTVRDAVTFLDNVITVNSYPLAAIKDLTQKTRKIGLGVMGFADLLYLLEIPYASEEGLALAEDLMNFITKKARETSRTLATKRGNFPAFEESTLASRYSAMRNATVTTIAPTGTLSILANTSSGIEPNFSLSYTRHIMGGVTMQECNPVLETVLARYGLATPEIMAHVASKGSVQEITALPEQLRRVLACSQEIPPSWHVRMQAAFQHHTDNAVSKTINFPHDASKAEVAGAYLEAYQTGCKGLTVYRDGSRDNQVLQHAKTAETPLTSAPAPSITRDPSPRKRPSVTLGSTRRIKTGCGNLYVTLNMDTQGRPVELFATMGKAGGCAASQTEAIGRLASTVLRSDSNPLDIAKQLRGISCHRPIWDNGGKILSCADAIGQAIEASYRDGLPRGQSNLAQQENTGTTTPEQLQMFATEGSSSVERTNNGVNQGRGACPECGGSMEFESGCATCKICGYAECG